MTKMISTHTLGRVLPAFEGVGGIKGGGVVKSNGMDYTEGELRLHIHQERNALVKERIEVSRRLRQDSDRQLQIDERLEELDGAENLLEGGL